MTVITSTVYCEDDECEGHVTEHRHPGKRAVLTDNMALPMALVDECQWVGLSPDGETRCPNAAEDGKFCSRHAAVARSYDFEQAIANYRRHR